MSLRVMCWKCYPNATVWELGPNERSLGPSVPQLTLLSWEWFCYKSEISLACLFSLHVIPLAMLRHDRKALTDADAMFLDWLAFRKMSERNDFPYKLPGLWYCALVAENELRPGGR